VILGVAASSMEIFKAEGMLAPYAPAGFSGAQPQVTATGAPAELGRQDVFAAVVCYNTVEGARKNIPQAETWRTS
jgi:iron(III) transport system substrate-binding protein